MTVVDSDVLIDALRGRREAKDRLTTELRSGEIATTTINVFELESGVRSEHDAEKIIALLAPFRVLSFNQAAAREAAAIRRQLESEGRAIGMADYMIAGICRSRRARLLTRNREHFERVAGLALSLLTG